MPPPLHVLLNQINAAATNGLHVIAIGMAVALPDICAALAAEDGRSLPTLYKAWCVANLKGEQFSFITPEVLYGLRCGVLHQGRMGDLPHSMTRVIFSLPGTMGFTNCLVEGCYFYSVDLFCKNMCDAAHEWHEANKSDPNVAANSKRMMQYHPDGFAEAKIKGVPLIT